MKFGNTGAMYIILVIGVLIGIVAGIGIEFFDWLPYNSAPSERALSSSAPSERALSYNMIPQVENTTGWNVVGFAGMLPLFGNSINYNFALEEQQIKGRPVFRRFYRIRHLTKHYALPIVQDTKITNGDIIEVAKADSPYTDKFLVSMPLIPVGNNGKGWGRPSSTFTSSGKWVPPVSDIINIP